MSLQGKKILLAITGGIAAYKSAELSRQLIKTGAEVRCVMTKGAQAFITPMTFQALTGNPVHEHLLDADAEAAMGHIELARWADLVLIAPATADIISKLAAGAADDLLTTVCLATSAPIAVAPAMNQQMWANKATQANVAKLNERGFLIWGPDAGDQACGDVGPGRMVEPEGLTQRVIAVFQEKILEGQHWVVTAGPTVEAIDPVRYLANRSSGKMGYAIADMAAKAGATVTLISGPVCLDTPSGVKRVSVESAESMLSAVKDALKKESVFVSCAAVADYKPLNAAKQKMKKSGDEGLSLDMTQNPDILKWVSNESDAFCVGFAAETQNVSDYAKSKMQRKGITMICANDVSRSDIGFSCNDNELLVYYQYKDELKERMMGPASKQEVAKELVTLISQVR